MFSLRAGRVLVFVSTLAILPAFGSRIHRVSTSGHSRVTSSRKSKRQAVSHLHGQRAIDSNRATEIQAALIQKKYLSGAASGQWDAQTQVAMRQYQQDHGWQTKLMPDSRALISLGLGPNHAAEPAIRQASAVSNAPVPTEMTDQVQSDEPAANTLASVHSLSR